MASVNKIHLLGNLGRDPELKTFENDKQKCTFSVATSEKWGETTTTQWHNIVIWGKVAGIAAQYLKKGSSVYLEGKVTYREYDNKEGVKVKITEIVCDQMQLMGKAPEATQSDESPLTDGSPAPADKPKRTKQQTEEESSDLPFALTIPLVAGFLAHLLFTSPLLS